MASYTLLGCNVYPNTDGRLLDPPVWTLVVRGEGTLLSSWLCDVDGTASGDGIGCVLICVLCTYIIYMFMFLLSFNTYMYSTQ